MSDRTIKILFIEDNSTDFCLIREKLIVAQRDSWNLPRFEIEHIRRLQPALARLEETESFDVVLSDLELPDSSAEETVATLREHAPQMPMVFITGRENEILANKAVQGGVQDFLYKNDASGGLIARSLLYAIERQQTRDALEQCVEERTAELRQVNAALQAEIAEHSATEDALRESESRYCSLFQDYPISIWEEDFSEVKTYLDDLRASGVTDFAAYFEEHPEAVMHCLGLVRIIDANEAALALRGAESKGDFSQGLDGFLSEEALAGFADELVQIAGGATRVEVDAADRTDQGDRRHLAVTWQVAPGHEETLARCLVSVRDITERKETERALQAREARARQKLVSVLSPDGDLSGLGLADIIDIESVQALMDDFYALTDIGIAIVDLEGEVLVATGWQDICTKFHRVHSDTCRHCLESDIELSSGVEPGTYKLYKCKNHMWDMATPIMVDERHVGNLFLGQFFFADETVDRELFRRQAQQYGFDEAAYLAALDRVPRWSHEKIDRVFKFYIQFADMISDLSHSNLQLARALTEKERLLAARKASEQKFRGYIEHAPYAVFVTDEAGRLLEVNEAASHMTGYDREALLGMHILDLAAPDRRVETRKHLQTVVEHGFETSVEPYIRKDGSFRWWSMTAVRLSETRFLSYAEDVTERRQAVEALEKREERYRRLVEGSPNLLYIHSNKRGMLYWSPRVEDVLKYTPEALSEDPHRWHAAIHPDDIAMVDAAITGADKGSGFSFEYRIMDADGDWHWFRDHFISKRQIKDETIIEGLATDITERKQAEIALRESEAKMRSIFRAAPVGVGLVSDRKLLEVNDRLCEMVGYDRGELVGQSARILYPTDEDYEYVGREKYRQIQEHGTGTVETRFQRKDGTILDVLLSSTPLDLSDLSPGVTFTALDITERNRAEEALRESEERLKLTIHSAPIGVGIVDREGEFVDYNAALAEMVGYSREELLALSFAGFTHPDDLEREWQLIEELWDGESTEYRMEKRYVHKDGHVVWVDVAASRFQDDAGELAFGFAFVQDITERVHAREARRLNEQRMQALLELTQMREASLPEITDFVLAQAVNLTSSEIGFLGFIDEDEEQMTLHAWSEKAMRGCEIDDKPRHFWLDEAGVWAEAVRQQRPLILNEYARPHPQKKGYPEGHVPLTRLLSVPMAEVSGVEAVIAVANKEAAYDEADVRQIQLLSEGMLRLVRERRAAADLRRSEKRFRTLVENVVDWIWQVDENGIYTYASPQVAAIMGYTVSEVLGKTPFDFMAPEETARVGALFAEAAAAQESIKGLEDTLIAKDGREILFETNATPLFGADGELVGYMGTCRDITERKQAEEALRASEAMLRQVIDLVPYPIYAKDNTGRFVLVNRAGAQFAGLTVDQMEGHLESEWVSDQKVLERIRAGDRAVLESGEAKFFPEERFVDAHGREYVMQTTKIPFAYEEEKPAGVLGISIDITEIKQAEEALQESERQKNLILNSTAEMIVYYDTDLRIIWANRAAAESVGKTPEEMVGAHCYELWHGRECPCVDCPVLKARDEKVPCQSELQMPDGRYWFLRGYPILDEDEEVVALVKFGQDVTERKQAQETLREAEVRYRTVADFTYDWELWENPDGTLRYVSPSCERVTGYSVEQFKRDPALTVRIIEPDDKGIWTEHRRVIEETGRSDGIIQFRIRRKDGETVWIEHACQPVLDAEERFLGWRVSNRDITERKQAQEKAAQYAVDLQRSNEDLQQFAYVVSHDLQAPLRTIKGYLKILVEDYEQRLDEHADLYIHQVVEGAERMQAMIMALLNLSRVETRGAPFAPTDCALLVAHVLEDLRSIIEEADADVRCDPLPTLPADRGQLARVFQNLIANAIKFRREDVTPRVHISAEREGNVWTFAVADNGIGLDPVQAERIFQIFQRLYTDEEYPGLGIGLALCKRIVERHGGRIWVESEPGAGSTFYFTLPAETETS